MTQVESTERPPVPARPRRSRLGGWLTGGADIQPGEGRSVLAAGLLFFILLAVIMILRPVREALGLMRGIESVRRLFFVTLSAMLVLAPLFGWLVSRVRRGLLVTVALRICALLLLAFAAGLALTPTATQRALAAVYYTFHSVFNLFVVSLFWAFMADVFTLAESKRLYPAIAIGGTLGALAGSLVPWELADHLPVSWLFLAAAGLLELAVHTARLLLRTRGGVLAGATQPRRIGGHPVAGITAVVRSPYLLAIAAFVLVVGMVSTLLYFTSMRLVARAGQSLAERTTLFAHINVWTQAATLLAQAFLTARIIRLAGVSITLCVLPVVALGSMAALALAPTLAVFTVANAIFRAAQRGVTRPARETLFTVLTREEKYKAKSFLDTFGFRAGDATGAQLEPVLATAGGFLPAVVVLGLNACWIALALYLGRMQSRLARG